MAEYSDIKVVKRWRFRYNYTSCLLEVLDLDDEPIDAQGLNLENWKDNPEAWCEQYADELNITVAHERERL